MFPGQLVSYKKHVRGGSLPEGARLVSFHGKPDPEDVDEDFVKLLLGLAARPQKVRDVPIGRS